MNINFFQYPLSVVVVILFSCLYSDTEAVSLIKKKTRMSAVNTEARKLWGKDVVIDLETFPTEDIISSIDGLTPHVEHGWFRGSGDYWLHYRKFVPKEEPKAVVIYQHGIQAHSGIGYTLKDETKVTNYALLAEQLVENGIAVYLLDMRGHGFSEGLRFYVPDYSINVDDFDNFGQFIAADSFKNKDLPLFLGGDSYGATVCLHVSRRWQDNPDKCPAGFRGFIVTAPAIFGDLPPLPVVYFLRYILKPLIPTRTPFFMPNPVSSDRIWRNYEQLKLDPIFNTTIESNLNGSGRPFRLGTATSLLSALEDVRETIIPGLNVPFCASHGTADEAVPITGTVYLDEKSITPDADKIIYKEEGKFHDLYSEQTRHETISNILTWINSRLDKAPLHPST